MNIERWNQFTLHQKLGNIGSEVASARLWEEKQNFVARNKALERILEILDVILAGELTESARKELSRTKEIINAWYAGSPNFEYSPTLLEQYFTQFVYLKS